MKEAYFYQVINSKAKELNINPLLLLSGIEGLYTFREIPVNAINYDFLDSLILTILALRIGDEFHAIAEENLSSSSTTLREAAGLELSVLSSEEIQHSSNPFLQSFATILNGRSTIRRYHQKALEAAALEVKNAQELFTNKSISFIILDICKHNLSESLDLASLFNQ